MIFVGMLALAVMLAFFWGRVVILGALFLFCAFIVVMLIDVGEVRSVPRQPNMTAQDMTDMWEERRIANKLAWCEKVAREAKSLSQGWNIDECMKN